MVSTDVPGQIEGSTKPSTLVISRSEHNCSHSRLNKCTGAHRAGFQGHDQRTVVETPVTPQPSGLLQCNQFGMAKGIVSVMPAVASVADRASFPVKYNRRHGHFTTQARFRRTLKQDLHPASEPLIPLHAHRVAH